MHWDSSPTTGRIRRWWVRSMATRWQDRKERKTRTNVGSDKKKRNSMNKRRHVAVQQQEKEEGMNQSKINGLLNWITINSLHGCLRASLYWQSCSMSRPLVTQVVMHFSGIITLLVFVFLYKKRTKTLYDYTLILDCRPHFYSSLTSKCLDRELQS